MYIYGTEAKNKYGRTKVYIHKLVHDHFSQGTTSSKPFVHHKDGNERNNAISNLTATDLETNLKARKYFFKEDGKVKRKLRSKVEKKKEGKQ